MLKGYVKVLLDRLNLVTEEKSLEDERFGDALEITANGKTIARLGKVSPKLLKEFDIDQDCFYAEIELETCQALRKTDNFKFVDIPKFNKIRRDLALLVDKDVSYADLYASARKNKSKFLKNINLFDVYRRQKLTRRQEILRDEFRIVKRGKNLRRQRNYRSNELAD